MDPVGRYPACSECGQAESVIVELPPDVLRGHEEEAAREATRLLRGLPWRGCRCRPPGEFFFDAHGALHRTCTPDEPGAGAFGPTGCSRPASPEEARLEIREGETAYAAAKHAGRLAWKEWDYLLDQND
jgi:hypothetical protein